jgi:hypothetical protein
MRVGGGRRNSTVAQAWPSVTGHSEILGQGGVKPRPCAVAAAKIPALSGGDLNLAISEKDTRREREPASFRPPGPPSGASSRAPFGPTLALTVVLAVAGFAVALAVVMLLSSPTPLPAFHTQEDQQAESALYVVSFALILPVALIAAPRLADTITAGPNGGAFSLLAASLVATLAASILLTRVLPGGGGVVEVLAVVGMWWIGAIALLARARQARPWERLLRAADLFSHAWAVAGTLMLGTVLAFTHLGSISPVALALGAVVVPAVLVVYARRSDRLPRVSPRWGVAIDATIVVLLLLAVPNLVIFGASNAVASLGTYVIQFHHNFLLGPANEVLAGRAVLVDTASQYGIAPIYLLAAWFQLAPIGYGTLGFLDGVLFALLFASGYGLLRLAGTSRLIAASALALAVIVLIYNLVYSVGTLPNHGPLRFGLPMVLILAAVVEARWPRHSGAARAMQLTVLGLSSIWALEAFAYTLFTYAALACFQAWMRPGPGRVGWLARQAALAVLACLAAQLIFVAATLAFAGQLPDYGWYLAFLRAFLAGNLAEVTYDFSAWSPGLAVGVAYAASAAAFVLLVRSRGNIVARERTALVALCGTTAYGIALFSYFVDRSLDHVLPYVSLPALLAGALWLSLLMRRGLVESRSARLGGLAFALTLAVLLVSVAWSSVGERFSQSALAEAAPGGESLRGSLHRLWNPPPLDPQAPQGELLLQRYMPDERRVLILVSPDLATEILMRSGRANELPFSYPTEDNIVGSWLLPALGRAVDELKPGDRLLMQRSGLEVLAALKKQPSRDVLVDPVVPKLLTQQQEWVLQRIRERFKLRVIHRDAQGFVVATLTRRT